MNNIDYFNDSTSHKEGLIDPYYHCIVDRNAIPKTKEEDNELTISNNKVIRYISSLETQLIELKHSLNDKEVLEIFELIIKELKTKGMNYSAFCQYFNVHNMNYSIFDKLSHDEKIEVLKYMIIPYINDRHDMYNSQGYSNIVLQVMSDNYSHKRKGSYGANKIADLLKIIGIQNLVEMKSHSFNQQAYFLLSDKNGKTLFIDFANRYGIKLSEDGKETKKYPDAFIKIGDDYFIVEQKNMKENGGGQDKQTQEITDFIDKKPEFEKLHYITFVDGIYFNQIDKNATGKTLDQYNDIITVLKNRSNNYFVNSYGFKKLMEDYFNRNR